jgi:hypothetical protein
LVYIWCWSSYFSFFDCFWIFELSYQHSILLWDRSFCPGIAPSRWSLFASPSSSLTEWCAQKSLHMGSSPLFYQWQVSFSPQDHLLPILAPSSKSFQVQCSENNLPSSTQVIYLSPAYAYGNPGFIILVCICLSNNIFLRLIFLSFCTCV